MEEFAARADLLLEKAVDIQLGLKNQTVLLQQAQSSREMISQLQDHFRKKYLSII